MNFDLADLRACVAVAKHRSFRAAAEELHLSQPALSRRIEKLETALGVRLFHRTTRKVDVTKVGREFAYRATDLLEGLDESLLGIRDIARRVTGEVTVACIPSAIRFFLPAVLKEYHRLYPGIMVRVIDQGANDVVSTVTRGEADFGINYIGTQDPQLEFERILTERFVLACPRDHPLAKKKQVRWAELAAHDYMTVTKASGNRMLFDMALTQLPTRPRWFCEAQHVSTLVSFVEAGLGVAAVPELAMPPAGEGNIVRVPLVEPALSRSVGLIRRVGRGLPPAAQQLYSQISASPSAPTGAKSTRPGPGYPSAKGSRPGPA